MNLNQKLTKLGHRRLDIKLEDIQELEEDIKRMICGASQNRQKKLKQVLKVLKLISSNQRNKTIPILWYCNNGLVGQYPIELQNFEDEGIDCMDFVIRPNNAIVARIKYEQLTNIIAFEMMHKDMGYSHRDMEEILKDYGIITQHQANVLEKLVKLEEPYKMSKIYKINKSNYRQEEDNAIFDYFQNTLFYTDCYEKPVEYSCRYAISFILDNLLDLLREYNVPFTLCASDDISITFLIDKDKAKEFMKAATEPITVRAFGRLFDTIATVESIDSEFSFDILIKQLKGGKQ